MVVLFRSRVMFVFPPLIKYKVFEPATPAASPDVVFPVKFKEGVTAPPAGSVRKPAMTSPDLSKLSDDAPVTFPTISPDPFRSTMVSAVAATTAEVAEFWTLPVAVIVASFPSVIAALSSTSAFTSSEDFNKPPARVFTTPTVLVAATSRGMVISPFVSMVIFVVAAVMKYKLFEAAAPHANPVVRFPVKRMAGVVVLPAADVTYPDPSRSTIESTVAATDAEVAEF